MTSTTYGLIIVLGSPNAEDGSLYSVAQERCDLAIIEYTKRPGWKMLLTGGYGQHFNTTNQPHAAYLKQYLCQRGIPSEAIVAFAESANTLEDASCAKPIILNEGVSEVLVITSDFHKDRAAYIFRRAFADTHIQLSFAVCQTNAALYPFDLDAQREHEQNALYRLKANDDRRV
ncbi:MAG: YdcF family protein [Chloroflexota bacterium]